MDGSNKLCNFSGVLFVVTSSISHVSLALEPIDRFEDELPFDTKVNEVRFGARRVFPVTIPWSLFERKDKQMKGIRNRKSGKAAQVIGGSWRAQQVSIGREIRDKEKGLGVEAAQRTEERENSTRQEGKISLSLSISSRPQVGKLSCRRWCWTADTIAGE